MNNDFPRRNQVDKMLPAEKLIFDAMQEIEKLGADEKLTDAQILISKAKNLIGDYIDAHPELLPSEETNTNETENPPENGNGGVEVPTKPPPPEPQ